jgi:hypothetical protein
MGYWGLAAHNDWTTIDWLRGEAKERTNHPLPSHSPNR